jgi:hypothetical protein
LQSRFGVLVVLLNGYDKPHPTNDGVVALIDKQHVLGGPDEQFVSLLPGAPSAKSFHVDGDWERADPLTREGRRVEVDPVPSVNELRAMADLDVPLGVAWGSAGDGRRGNGCGLLRLGPPMAGTREAPSAYSTQEEDQPQEEGAIRRDGGWVVRAALALLFSAIFLLTIILSFTHLSTKDWIDTKEWLQALLPAETALIGSATGFYFGASGLKKP